MERFVALSVFLAFALSCQGAAPGPLCGKKNPIEDLTSTPGVSQELLDSFQTMLSNAFSSLQDKVEARLKLLQIDIDAKISAKLGELEDVFKTLGSAFTDCLDNEVTPILKDLLIPTCYNGMAHDDLQRYHPLQLIKEQTLGTNILCDTQSAGGGWIVIQRRTQGIEGFYRSWDDYKTGFGTAPDDFWFGNENLYTLTNKNLYELRIDFNTTDQSLYADYDSFRVEGAADNYRLRLGSHSGTLVENSPSNGFSYHNGYQFSTPDQDHDISMFNCPLLYHGALWYGGCMQTNLNGKWAAKNREGLVWSTGSEYLFATATQMKIRRKKLVVGVSGVERK